MMPGPYAAKQVIVQYLKSDLPQRLATHRDFWDIDPVLVVPPEDTSYLPYAPPSLEYMVESLPAIYAVIINTQSMGRVGYDENLNPIYRATYNARIYVWVKQQSALEATASRDHFMTVLRTMFLDEQCFNNETLNGKQVKFDEGLMTEEFSDLIPSKGDRWAAGGYIAFPLTIDEVVSRDLIGQIEDFQVETVEFLEQW